MAGIYPPNVELPPKKLSTIPTPCFLPRAMSHGRPQQSVGNSGNNNRILSGSVLPSTIPHPPPPSSPPPNPTHICKIAILGDVACGKSSLIHKFIHRRYATPNQSCCIGDDNDNREKYGHGTTQSAAASYNSLGTTSLGTTTIGGYEDAGRLALADYYKKNVTIWDHYNNNSNENTSNVNNSVNNNTIEESNNNTSNINNTNGNSILVL